MDSPILIITIILYIPDHGLMIILLIFMVNSLIIELYLNRLPFWAEDFQCTTT